VVALGLFAVSGVLRRGLLEALHPPGGAVVMSVVGVLVLAYSGYLGGILVYEDGIAVGRHRRTTRTPRSTISVRTDGGIVGIANDDALRDGETLRVEINGTVMVVARVAGRLHAVQEFCTHRFGPLSEAAIDGCELICPWHSSRFDLRTGGVVAGPAKIPLRTFNVESRDGKIWVEVPRK
jgi:nitrite reductase/ring-hydroxylating ferredoxin subunit